MERTGQSLPGLGAEPQRSKESTGRPWPRAAQPPHTLRPTQTPFGPGPGVGVPEVDPRWKGTWAEGAEGARLQDRKVSDQGGPRWASDG